VIGSQKLKVARIVRQNEPTTESNSRGDHEGIDRQLAVTSRHRQEVAGDSGNPHPSCHDPGEPATEDVVNRFVSAGAPVKLDEDGRGDAHRLVPPLSASQRSPDPLVTPGIVPRAGEG
jgi:hypothetical protein